MKIRPIIFILIVLIKIFKADETSSENSENNVKDWDSFVSKYNKSYKNDTIKIKRKKEFLANLDKINKQNINYNNGKASYPYGITPFSDLSEDEFNEFVKKGYKKSSLKNRSFSNFEDRDTIIKNQVNWLSELPDVKNQGYCGSCWAMAAATAIEFEYSIKIGRKLSLSSQQLLDCTYPVSKDGCNGGDSIDAFEYLKRVYGIEADSPYPYTGLFSMCNYKSEKVAAINVSYTVIPSGDELSLIRALNNHVVVITLNVPTEFQNLGSNAVVYNGVCSSNISDANHNAVVVGYTEKYYIVRMSWGDNWGINGTILLPRNENKCGIANMAIYPTVAPLNNKIFNNDVLKRSDNLTSLNGRYLIGIDLKSLALLDKTKPNSPVWSVKNLKSVPYQLNLTNGNIELQKKSLTTLWSSSILDLGHPGHHLELLDNGVLAIFDGNTNPIYSSGGNRLQDTYVTNKIYVGGYMNENEYIKSPNGNYKAVLQSDGNFVVYDLNNSNISVWSTSTWYNTNTSGPYKLVLQEDGNFVLKDKNNNQLWATNTSSNSAGQRIELQDTGILALFDGNDNPTWSSGGYIYKINLKDENKWIQCDSISFQCIGISSESDATYFQLQNYQDGFYQFKSFQTSLCLYTNEKSLTLALKSCSIETITNEELFDVTLKTQSGFSLFWNGYNLDIGIISSCNSQIECSNWVFYWYFNVIIPNDPLQGAYFYKLRGGQNYNQWIKCNSNTAQCTGTLIESDASFFQVSLIQGNYFEFELDYKSLCLFASPLSNTLSLTICSNKNLDQNALFNKLLVTKGNSTLYWNGEGQSISIVSLNSCGSQSQCAYWQMQYFIDKTNIAVKFTSIVKQAGFSRDRYGK